MILHDKFIFIHTAKCAGNSIREFLREKLDKRNYFIPTHKHHRACKLYEAYKKERFIFSSIRNPFSWYVSLYLQHKRFDSHLDQGTLKNFDVFLKKITFESAFDEKRFSVENNIGVFTGEFLKMHCQEDIFSDLEKNMTLSFFKDLIDEYLITDEFVTLKNLSSEKLLSLIHKNSNLSLSEPYNNLQSKNTSQKSENEYYKLYDKFLIELINYKDRFLLEYFDFDYQDIVKE